MHARLQLTPRHWYGWQMLPGYDDERYGPYFSPILVHEVTPRKTGKGILTVAFFNAFYPEGVHEFTLDLRILKREASYLVSEILYEGSPTRDRTAIISNIEFEWIRRYCPELWASYPPSHFSGDAQHSAPRYLKAVFHQPD
jgi:hypothetical protein